jgi:TDG/mug DNA glycosylase family protein
MKHKRAARHPDASQRALPRASETWRPSAAELSGAVGKTIPDVLAPKLRVWFVGINPGLYSGAVGHHFARPGNRFWPALELSGFTPHRLSPFEDGTLLAWGLGLTNLVERTTARADELSIEELREGAERLDRKVRRLEPKLVAVLGVSAYRAAFARPKAGLGPQPELIHGARVWVLPNPSGLNAHHQLPDLARRFGDLRALAAQLSAP